MTAALESTAVDVDPVSPLGVSPPATRPRMPAAAWATVAVLTGLVLVEGARQGGFWPVDALVVACASVVLLAVQAIVRPPDRRGWLVIGSLVLLAVWWLARAAETGSAATFLPLGASILGFATAFAAVRTLEGRARVVGASAVASIGAAGSLVGFAGLAFRWFPMAMPAQGLWRLSSTLTYSDAAGLVLAMCLLVACAGSPPPWLARAAVCLCAGGLLAAQSRGALVAFAAGCAFVPLQQYRRFLVPLAAGASLGVAAIATSPASAALPWLAVAVAAAAGVAVLWDPVAGQLWGRVASTPIRIRILVVGGLLVLGVIGAAVLVHHEIGLRTFAPSDGDRAVEWSAAAHQFASSPLFGVGPDRLLQFHAADGTYAHFAHNEYLQVAADSGLIGLVLLLAVGVSLATVVRRTDAVTSCAVAALVCLAIGGLFDFDWHLPFVGLLGGWVAGLATRRNQ